MCRMSCVLDGVRARHETLEIRPEAYDWTDLIYSRRSLINLPGDRGRRARHKRCQPFFDPTHSFSYGKIRAK